VQARCSKMQGLLFAGVPTEEPDSPAGSPKFGNRQKTRKVLEDKRRISLDFRNKPLVTGDEEDFYGQV